MKTPIAIFTYNRPDHARLLFESLLKCSRLDDCSVHIFCDGPKTPEHLPGVLAMRQLASEFGPLLNNAVIIEREKNLGLARSIVSGVTELCDQYGRVIVLEDDFILHPFFLEFMLQSLDHYADDEHVAQVAGYLPPIHPNNSQADSFFLPLTTSCGWATWQRAWSLFSWETGDALDILEADTSLRTRFDLNNSYPYSNMLRSTIAGHADSWAILWYWHNFRNGKLTLYPRRSLVWVGGFDNLATHTKFGETPKFYDQSLDSILQGKWKAPISFPNITKTDKFTFNKLKNFLQYQPSRSLIMYLRQIVTRLVK